MSSPTEGGTFHSNRPGLRKLLGDLEADIMEAAWARGQVTFTVRDILGDLEAKRAVAYTTVMTVMGNLTKKGVLSAEKIGKTHLYRATRTRDEFTEAAVARVVDELLRDFAGPTIAHFTRVIGNEERP